MRVLLTTHMVSTVPSAWRPAARAQTLYSFDDRAWGKR
jgi:hypothetical protein